MLGQNPTPEELQEMIDEVDEDGRSAASGAVSTDSPISSFSNTLGVYKNAQCVPMQLIDSFVCVWICVRVGVRLCVHVLTYMCVCTSLRLQAAGL